MWVTNRTGFIGGIKLLVVKGSDLGYDIEIKLLYQDSTLNTIVCI